MKFEFKNPLLKVLVPNNILFGNLVVNDVPRDGNGNIAVKLQKPRKDGKVSLMYYTANMLSLENIQKGFGLQMQQSHSSDGKTASWKNAISPELMNKIGAGGSAAGYIAELTLSKPYKIPYVGEGGAVMEREVFKLTIYIPSLEVMEDVTLKALQRVGVIAPIAESEPEHKTTNATANGITNGQGGEINQEEEQEETV